MIEKRINIVSKVHPINKVNEEFFYPQFRKIILWGLLKLRWQDYSYDYCDDILLGLEPTSHRFSNINEATEFLKQN